MRYHDFNRLFRIFGFVSHAFRIFNFFKRWIEKFWTDFDLEPQTNAPLLLGFVDPIITGPDQVYASLAKMIRTKIEAKQVETD